MIHFEALWLLLFFPLPWVIRKCIKPATLNYNSGLKVPFYSALISINRTNLSASWPWFHKIALLIWSLLLLAAAGPQWLGRPVDLPRSGRDILLAIDLSGSMQIPDMEMNNQSTDRISIVKEVAQQFIKDREGDRLGLLLFGSRAYLQTPLTFDLQTVSQMLLDSTVGLAGTQTAIGDAIGLAVKHFKNYQKDNKVLILLTDGVNNEGAVSPLEAARIARQYDIRIYTVGLGANQVIVPSLLGPQTVSTDYELDEETLKDIAKMTNGMYFRAKNPKELLRVYEQLNKIEPRMRDKQILRPVIPLYDWPLGVAFILLLGLMVATVFPVFRRRRE